jgi:hypothetical protein
MSAPDYREGCGCINCTADREGKPPKSIDLALRGGVECTAKAPGELAKVGDVVTVRVRIADVDFQQQLVDTIASNGDRHIFERRDIVAIETPAPRPLQVGDKVRRLVDRPDEFADLIAINGDFAWVRWVNGAHGTFMLRDLVRV